MKIKVIRTEAEHREALRAIEQAVTAEPASGTPEADDLETLALLVERYEKEKFALSVPDPIDALLFRMEQANLAPRDLVSMIGSRSKVSEVLSRKRPLSLNMIRALHSGLGIPAQVLIGGQPPISPVEEPSLLGVAESKSPDIQSPEPSIAWHQYPLREMLARGYFDNISGAPLLKAQGGDLTSRAREIMLAFMRPLGLQVPLEVPMLLKRTLTTRAARAMNLHALSAWSMRVLLLAGQNPPPTPYEPEQNTFEFLSDVARLSWSERGPLLAQEFLFKHGISLVIEPHLPRTHLDGAAIAFWADRPVIGLTLRHDRLDNFWFCLLHELAHLKLHFWNEERQFMAGHFFDDMDAEPVDTREKEADDVAGEALVPDDAWRKSPVSVLPSPQAVQRLATQLRVHPAIVAGRVRHTKNSYRLLNNLVGQGEVRKHFSHVSWKGEEE